MAHKTLIGGTAYEIGGGRTLVNGTGYAIDKGKTMVGGTVYGIDFVHPVTIVADFSGFYNITASVDGAVLDTAPNRGASCVTNSASASFHYQNTPVLH